MAPLDLSDNHRRSLSVTCRLVEKALIEIEDLLTRPPQQVLTSRVEATYEPAEKRRLLASVQKLQEQNHQMFEALSLVATTISDRQIVEANLSHLWVILQDSKPEHLKRFGALPQEIAREVDLHVQALLNTVSQLLALHTRQD